jgi:tRNA-specific 2-thiouridylase
MVPEGQKVLVALSGGVDSSVAAALLQDAGYSVEGAFIVTWTAPWLPCTWRDERRDAMRVAAHLHIPFHTVDLRTEYERDVVQYLVREYVAGRTPNPDVMCNKYIKFGGLLAWAHAHGFTHIATGHYAQAIRDGDGVQLHAGVDTNKDQSYFLWTLTQAQLSRTLFPVGAHTKQEIRAIAKQYGLHTASKKDSQGLCFLGNVDMKDFLKHYVTATEGTVVDLQGSALGTHEGALFYTLGQRHGFTITKHTPDTQPMYVVAKDVAANTITVAPRGQHGSATEAHTITLSHCNWIPDERAFGTGGDTLRARFRYRQATVPVRVTIDGTLGTQVTFDTPQAYVPVGQSLVVYSGTRCLGGGVIASVA